METFRDEIEVLREKLKSHNTSNSYAFYGSSTIRLWECLAQDFAPRNIINLGFGGSSYGLMAIYYELLFADYQHDHVILYAGDNDHSVGHASAKILENFRRLTHEIWSDHPSTHIHVISVKPSPHRENQLMKIRETNDLLKNSILSQENGRWISVFDEMLSNGRPRPELFTEDMLHMNEAGYDIWRNVLQDHFNDLGI